MLAYIHQLFSANQCHAYIHTLRWQDRPLPCLRCQSHAVGLWGPYHYRPGCKRFWCHGCRQLRVLRGLSKTHLPGSLGFLQCLRNCRQQTACEQAELVLDAALDPTI